jgi:hypothetical protein
MTSRKSTCTAPPVAQNPNDDPNGLATVIIRPKNRNLRSSPTRLFRPDPNENLRFWHGDGDSRVSSTSSCLCCCSFDTLQSLATLRFLHPARGRMCCLPPPRAAVPAAAAQEHTIDAPMMRAASGHSLSIVRVHLQQPHAHALVQTARHSIAPRTLGFQTRERYQD